MYNKIEICCEHVRNKQFQLEGLKGISLRSDECLAIVGPNGSGKSILTGIMSGLHVMQGEGVKYTFDENIHTGTYKNIKHIHFRDSYGSNDSTCYYQQRWNSTEIDYSNTVERNLGHIFETEVGQEVYKSFALEQLMKKPLIHLSSGEMRKYQLAKALQDCPQVLFIDNPYIGLDAAARDTLNILLSSLVESKHVQLVLVVARPSEIPLFISHIIPLSNKQCGMKLSRTDYFETYPFQTKQSLSPTLPTEFRQQGIPSSTSQTIIEMRNVSIKYGTNQILNNINWTVRKGEKWALSGPNGSGKSTLLSLICADNPQSYACDISLFGQRRGCGESIWDIKRKIGYISPELHRNYRENKTTIDIVASGLHDTIGLYKKINDSERLISLEWMKTFQIDALADRDFLTLSSGEQRLALLARTFVKSPPLIILDEPLHGLDDQNRELIISIIESYTNQQNKTAIIVTHYPHEFPSTITHNISLSAGKIQRNIS